MAKGKQIENSTTGRFKMDKYLHGHSRPSFWLVIIASWSSLLLGLILVFLYDLSSSSTYPSSNSISRLLLGTSSIEVHLEKVIRDSATVRSPDGICVLVTGAAGFIGSHVSISLKRRGDGVLGIDSFNNYYDPSLKRARQAVLERHGVYIVEGDINDVPLVETLFKIVPFTHVMHLAAQAGVRYAKQNPASYVRNNIAGFVSLLEVCKRANPQPAIVWASSSSVYGLNKKVPFSEGDRTDNPASLYAASKKAGEEIAHTYNHIYGLSLTALRFFTVYGPWGRPDMAYFFFTRDILKGKEIQIYEGANHGTVARDFTYIDDIVKGCLAALDTAQKSTGSGGNKTKPAQFRVYNLGNTTPVSVLDLVTILEKLLNVKAMRVITELPRNGDVQFTHANISLAQQELGYKPTTDLHTGLNSFVSWFLKYYGAEQES